MNENRLVEIPIEDLPQLRDLYKDRKTEANAYNMIQNYIDWFQKEPSLDFVKFYSLNGDWSDGTFVAKDSYLILFDTLDRSGGTSRLDDILCLLDYRALKVFNGYDSRLQFVVEKVVKHTNLNDNHMLNGSFDLYVLCRGIAVNLMESQQTGALGLLKVHEDYRRLGIASALITSIAKEIAATGQDERNTIIFNSLNDAEDRLLAAFNCLDSNEAYLFSGFPERILPTVEKYFKQLGGIQSVPTVTVWYHVPREVALEFDTEPPEGISLCPLRQEHVNTINSIWPHRAQGSDVFISRLIESNMNVGAYDKAGNLLAWIFRIPVGSLGILHVKNEYKRNGYGSLLVRVLSKKFAQMGIEVTAPVVDINTPSREMFKKLGFKEIDKVYWWAKP